MGFADIGPYGGLPDEEAAEEGGEAVKSDIAEEVEEVKNAAGGASFALTDSETGRIEKFFEFV